MEKSFKELVDDFKKEAEISKQIIFDFYISHGLKDSIDNRTYKVQGLSIEDATSLHQLLTSESDRLSVLQNNLMSLERREIEKSIADISNYIPAKNILKGGKPEKWVTELWNKHTEVRYHQPHSIAVIKSLTERPLFEVKAYIEKEKERAKLREEFILKTKKYDWAVSYIKGNENMQIPSNVLEGMERDEVVKMAVLQLENEYEVENQIDSNEKCYCDAAHYNARHQHFASAVWQGDKFVVYEEIQTY